ncbi:MAG: metallophosphoesterase family protein [Bacillota bacterium]
MKIAIFSDAHRNIGPLESVVEKLEDVDYFIYAGDGLDQVLRSSIAEEKLLAVRGNCDYGLPYPVEKIIKVAGIRIFLTHGHRYRIKDGLTQLYYKAQEVEADIVIFGHTHCRYAEENDDILFFNPGSISFSEDNNAANYGILEIKEGNFEYKHWTVSNDEK